MTTPAEDFFTARPGELPVIGIFRGQSPDQTVSLCRSAWNSGVRLVEIPLSGEQAVTALAAAVVASDGRPVGAGTVLTPEHVRTAASVGATFIVSPGLHPEVVRECHRWNIPCLPGVATATEIADALKLGCQWLKAFPAAQLGPQWIAAQLAPFPHVRFVATGGVDATNAAGFMRAGCRAVAVGSAFATTEGLAKLRTSLATFVTNGTIRHPDSRELL